ncbi:MAG TPA: Flp pilus assembly protein CpaB [Actinomycetota bacterium]|nr:Flp pilus assembly protein CpaB [Actinomycetota bacterium]
MSTIVLTRRKASLRSIFAVLFAIAATLAVYSYLSWMKAQIPVSGKLISMVVAARDLQAGETIDPSMLELVEHPSRYLPMGAFNGIDGVVGKVLSVPVFQGEAVTSPKLGSKGGVSGLVPAGTRAYFLAVPGGGIAPRAGDRVDVLATLPREVLGEPTTITVLRGKEVASMARREASASDSVGGNLGLEAADQAKLGITLFVTPEEAEKLAMAEALGKITLIFAPFEADQSVAPRPVRPSDLGA